ncbi:DJ-1/PfpI family protein [Phenylobacterium sp. LH3H17]|uniref:DJ-1/PfpI family protein n=1 Tax=Phenylobacterium sp. LH3H17 TaxID=2903901 RepID=UPI0020C9F986|nr:DJ-1/PfpI family protein [Phenylobacterium sp. LH3H17]UTP38246.1 DJ-1/PfpI family protein [Phenylobacterium sp. LH3H17]
MHSQFAAASVVAIAITLHPFAAEAHPGHDRDHLSVPAPKAGRARPLVVVVAENRGAETTDFAIPYGVLKEAGVTDVRSLSTEAGPVQLRRSIKVMADQTLGQFDAVEPAGADIVIVPAQVDPKDRALITWIQAQAAKGATIVSVCEGARVVANAGLLKGKRAVTHWSAINDLAKTNPDTTWVRDQRHLQDGAFISTTGVTASIPMSLALVEAIGGHLIAQATAAKFGVTHWSADHRTADFQLTKADIATAVGSAAAVWTHETVEAPVSDGVDEVALALRADAWGRSYRTKVVTTNAGRTPVRSRRGLTILPDAEARNGRYVIPGNAGPAAPQLDMAISVMGKRYGPAAVRLATIGLEYDPPAGEAAR